jgi:hypothetical protein
VGLYPSSFNRRVRKLRRLEWSPCGGRSSPSFGRRAGNPALDSSVLEVLHRRQVRQSACWGSPSEGGAWVRWGFFSV